MFTAIINTTTVLKSKVSSTLSVNKISIFILGLLLILLPSNLGKHFIFESSYVSGTLVDYLIPTFYLADLLVIAFIVVNLRSLKNNLFRPRWLFLLLGGFILWLLLSLLVHPSIPGLYKFGRILVYVLLMLEVSQFTFRRSTLLFFGKCLSISVGLQSLLAFYQVLFQRSLCGYLCLGETTLSRLSYGITKDYLGGQFMILPYGTFPHPNILGGFLAISLLVLLYAYFVTRQRYFLFSSLLGFVTLLLTRSDTAMAAFLFGFSGLLFTLWPRSQLLAVALVNPNLPSIWRRITLADYALKMFLTRPLTGVGLNNFIPSLPVFGYETAFPTFLQPVHNIYLLITAESGFPALAFFLTFLISIFVKLVRRHHIIIALVLSQLLFIGFFDHYLWTTPQGLLILWLTLGLAVSTIRGGDETSKN